MHLGYFSMPLHPPARELARVLAEDREAVILADRLGYSEAWIGEHFTSLAEPITDPFLFLATLIPETRTIRLGSAATVLDRLIALHDDVEYFGTLIATGHDWDDGELWRGSMRRLAEDVMPPLRQHADAHRPGDQS